MRKLLILSVLSLAVAGSSGCFHRGCGGICSGGLFGWKQAQPTPAMAQCCPPQPVQYCPPQPVAMQCCDPCAPQMQMAAPCCP